MRFFRIYIYLKFFVFVKSLITSVDNSKKRNIEKTFNKITNKKFSFITSQLRVGFVLVLQYLIRKHPDKNEIIISSYNLAEMVNICKNLKLKLVFGRLNENIFICDKDLKKKINHKTLGVVVTNMFNDHTELIKVKKLCRKHKVSLIEDNAIYFGNYYKNKKGSVFSGSFGNYSLHSFNIMKNISAMYGGLVSTNDKNFIKFAKKETENYKNFPKFKFLKQVVTFLVLKIFAINIFYKLFFFHLLKLVHQKDITFIKQLIYPSLKFNKKIQYNSYLNNIHPLSVLMINEQLKDKKHFTFSRKKRMKNNILYHHLFKKYKIIQVKTINLKVKSFQNFNEYPILVQNKDKLINYLFDNGIETKIIHYVDCHKIFRNSSREKSSQDFENKIICLPNHENIPEKYIKYIVRVIFHFYRKPSRF